MEQAWRAGQIEMIGWLGELYGLDRLDAYQLHTQISQTPIANVVDVNYSAGRRSTSGCYRYRAPTAVCTSRCAVQQ